MSTAEGDAGPLWVGLLGPVEARRGGVALPLGSAGRQAVFAILAMGAGQVVPRARLVDGLWERPPASAARIIQTYVGDLRRVLEPDRARWTSGQVLRTTDTGYLLDLPENGSDVRALDHLRARTATDLAAVDAALALWRGEPLSGVTGPFADGQRTRLTEVRLTLLERRARLLVDAGRAGDAAAELTVLAAEHPDRDSLRLLLMTALAASGRPARAIEVFHEGGRPGPGLRALHERILTGTQPGRVASGFVGRSAEVAAVRAVAARPAGLLWIEGPMGAGKSALLREALSGTGAACCEISERTGEMTEPPDADVVVIDDLHWAGDRAIRRCSRLLGEGRALVVATRPRADLAALRDRAARVITLGPLADADLAAMATADLARVVVRESGGNPGFAAALVAAAGDVDRVAHARVGVLPAALLDPLRRVALLGADRTRREVMAAHPGTAWLADAVAAGVLRESGGHVDFAQPAVRRVLVEGMPRAVRVVLHRELARDLAAAAAPADLVGTHLLDGATPPHGWARDWLVDNLDALAPALAVRLLRHAIAQDDLPAATRTEFTATLVRLLLVGGARVPT
ncbi:AfsR/SARP family transcriptional regulator [Actinokineospora diospyrosa]|uniref:DNA-binding transcriptional activator of the SARP family n=1 Tax=Actinokineospora diospyrosa TaxID=103728 RepID=A0ABT1IBW8_9PSEU|nr:BTAD domain-containing putative transcriptional regulator [Actinokineospora diospyrosa]MCP2270132.1 DNA-binding transcriptional activator of the SARP family [Actinokineospora diospyrosa]